MPTDTAVRFTVLGRAQTQGSIRAFVVNGHARLTPDNAKMKPWRQEVGWRALEATPCCCGEPVENTRNSTNSSG